MKQERQPALYYLADSSLGRFGSLFLWPHGEQNLLPILDFIHRFSGINVLRVVRVRHLGWASAIAWVYQFDNSRVLHLAAKTRYLRSKKKFFYFLFFRVDANAEPGIVQVLKRQLRDKFPASSVQGAGEHDHLFHIPDTSFESVRMLGRIEGTKLASDSFLPSSSLVARNPWSSTEFSLSAFVESHSLVANIYTKFRSLRALRSEVELVSTPHFKFAHGFRDPYVSYLRDNLGLGLRYAYSPARFDSLLSEPEFEDPIIARELPSGRYLILDGLHRACAQLARGAEEIEVQLK